MINSGVLSNAKTAFRLFSLLFLLNVALFIVLDVWFLFGQLLMGQLRYNTELRVESNALQERKFTLVDKKAELDSIKDYYDKTQKAVAEDASTENFLVPLVEAASTNGFSIASFRPTISRDVPKDEFLVYVDLYGDIRNIPAFFAALKKINRKPYMDRIIIRSGTETTRLSLTLKLFYLNPNSIDLMRDTNGKIDTEFIKGFFQN